MGGGGVGLECVWMWVVWVAVEQVRMVFGYLNETLYGHGVTDVQRVSDGVYLQ